MVAESGPGSLHNVFEVLTLGVSDLFMNSYLTSKMSSFYVANLVNSQLLTAIRALNLSILNRDLLRAE